ncbi:hypothetical protein RHOER0001_4616 [Rhodococcus erythropolis SK121]|nr:hypothetical protein RHOER0001_4616 [Rhodococcus erythropolis SK121]
MEPPLLVGSEFPVKWLIRSKAGDTAGHRVAEQADDSLLPAVMSVS